MSTHATQQKTDNTIRKSMKNHPYDNETRGGGGKNTTKQHQDNVRHIEELPVQKIHLVLRTHTTQRKTDNTMRKSAKNHPYDDKTSGGGALCGAVEVCLQTAEKTRWCLAMNRKQLRFPRQRGV